MTFPKNSAFNPEPGARPSFRLPARLNPAVTPRSLERTTSVHTSDIEQLEHDLRTLSFDANGPEDARTFEDLADRVASLYKG